MNRQPGKMELSNSAGVGILELLVVLTLIVTISSLAFVNFQNSSRRISLSEAARTFSVYLEKVRLDSVRRHGGASINIDSPSSYTVNIDSAGTGTIVARTITFPVGTRLSYTLPPATTSITPSGTPIIIAYDWRGRTANTISFTLTDLASGVSSSPVVVGLAGDISIDTPATGPVTIPTPQNTSVSTTHGIKSMR